MAHARVVTWDILAPLGRCNEELGRSRALLRFSFLRPLLHDAAVDRCGPVGPALKRW